MDWHEYIKQGPMYEFKSPKDEMEYQNLIQISQKLYSFYYGDLRYKNCAKIIIAEKTNPFAVAKGCNEYCFRFQCTQTGRQSKYIKENELLDFGISPNEANDGGNYLKHQDIDDNIMPKIYIVQGRISHLLRSAQSSCKSWHERYAEYLQSEEWQEKRIDVMNRDGFSCVLSKKTQNLQIHHLTYARVGNEDLSDLVTLNRDVHRLIHAGDKHYIAKLSELVK